MRFVRSDLRHPAPEDAIYNTRERVQVPFEQGIEFAKILARTGSGQIGGVPLQKKPGHTRQDIKLQMAFRYFLKLYVHVYLILEF